MNQNILSYLADCILNDIRSGERLEPLLLTQLISRDFLTVVRRKINEKDADWLERSLANKTELLDFALAVVGPLQNTNNFRILLNKLWADKALSFSATNSLIYRLLDFHDLPEEMHHEIYRFLSKHRDVWKNYVIDFYQGIDKCTQGSLQRLESDDFPLSKKWIYLCQLAWLSEETALVAKQLDIFSRCNSAITSFVSNDLRHQLPH